MHKVIMYSTATCSYCTRAKQLLDQKKIPFEEIRVDIDPEKRDEMVERSGRRTVPQIFIDNKHVGGFDDLWALEQSGQLEQLLK